MIIARGKKAIKPFPAGIWAAKRIADAAPLNTIAASAPGNFLIIAGSRAEWKSCRYFSPGRDQSLSALARETSWNETTAAPLPMTRFQTRLKLRPEPGELPKRDSLTNYP